MSETRNFVAVLPDGTEHFQEMRGTPFRFSNEPQDVASLAVREAGLTTKRSNPQTVKVLVHELEIKKGKLVRGSPWTFEITPSLEAMTEAEFNAEMKNILSGLPEEFHTVVQCDSWDHGHSSGYEEVLSYATELAGRLAPVVEVYTNRAKGGSR